MGHSSHAPRDAEVPFCPARDHHTHDPRREQGRLRRVSSRAVTAFARRKRSAMAQRVLGDASTLLAASLDHETTLAQVAKLAVPALADWCIVHLVEEDGSIRWLAAAHGDPAKEALARELQERYPHDPQGSEGVAQVVRTGRSVLYGDLTDAQRVARARDAEHLQLLRAMNSRAAMIVPMVAGEHTLGAISFLSTRPSRRYGSADLRLAEELARRAALAVDNARLHRQLQQTLHAREQFLTTISHDLKSPLTKIAMFAGLLEPCVAKLGTVDPEAVEWLGRIGTATGRMAAQINELLDLAHLQVGRQLELERFPTDLLTLVAGEVAVHQKMTKRHHLRLETCLSSLVGLWDAGRLERVVSNLLSNAVKYSPDGGDILVTLTREAGGGRREAGGGAVGPRIFDSCFPPPASWAVLAVQDWGVGIPAADLPAIGTRFHRGANVIGQISGTGVGLAATKQIVEQHGGTVTVASTEDRGTTVTIRLPLG